MNIQSSLHTGKICTSFVLLTMISTLIRCSMRKIVYLYGEDLTNGARHFGICSDERGWYFIRQIGQMTIELFIANDIDGWAVIEQTENLVHNIPNFAVRLAFFLLIINTMSAKDSVFTLFPNRCRGCSKQLGCYFCIWILVRTSVVVGKCPDRNRPRAQIVCEDGTWSRKKISGGSVELGPHLS